MKCSTCSHDVKPIVVSDCDGTLADYHLTFTKFVINYFGRPIAGASVPKPWWDGEGEMEDWLGLTKAEYREAKLAYRQGGNKRWLPAYRSARQFVDDLRAAGAEVWLCTTRPWQRLDNIDPDTREWLRRNGIIVDGLLYGDDKFAQLLSTVDPERVVGAVDDLDEQMLIGHQLGIPMFQVHRQHNSHSSRRMAPGGTLEEASAWALARINEWRSGHE